MKSDKSLSPALNISAEHTFRPMPYEVDFTGFLSNTVAPLWMEVLRVSLMDQYFPFFDNEMPEHLSVVAETQIKYIKPVRYSDVIFGRAWIESASFAKWNVRFSFVFKDTQVPMLDALQIGAFINPQTMQPVCIPAAIRHITASTKFV